MYDEGLKEDYYIHPETGESLPTESAWMKDPKNSQVLSQLLSKYITNVMKEIHTPASNNMALDEEARKKLAEELIKKYSK